MKWLKRLFRLKWANQHSSNVAKTEDYKSIMALNGHSQKSYGLSKQQFIGASDGEGNLTRLALQ